MIEEQGVNFYFWGNKCLWKEWMAEQARLVSEKLGADFQQHDIALQPELARRKRIFFPGTVEISDFKIPYPGTAEEMLASFKRRGPLGGELKVRKLPAGIPQRIEKLKGKLKDAAPFCREDRQRNSFREKEKWLEKHILPGLNTPGYIAYNAEEAVGAVEFVLEKDCPYPLPEKGERSIFVTCIYGSSEEGVDYRGYLIDFLAQKAREARYQALNVLAGEKTPYPNGPVELFRARGFEKEVFLERILLRNCWENISYLQRKL